MECAKTISESPAEREDQRNSTRYRAKALAYVNLGPGNGGTLNTVSEGGLSFQGIQPLMKGQLLDVSFRLDGMEKSFKTTGEIVWLNETGKGGGMRFVDLLEHARNLLHEWFLQSSSNNLEEQPVSLPSLVVHVPSDAAESYGVVDEENRVSAAIDKTLADVLRDTSRSRHDVIAAVDASRSAIPAPHTTDSKRAQRFPVQTWTPRSSRIRLSSGFRMFLILSFALAALIGVAVFQHYRGQSTGASSSASGDSPFGLAVERDGGDWRVHWNRNSELLTTAVRGQILVTDGPYRKELNLDTGELRSGSIIYTPATDDVVVRLQIAGDNLSEPVSESVRIVAGRLP